MRTDVKVGLVCVFAVVLAVAAYFALHSSKTNKDIIVSSVAVHPDTPSSTGSVSIPAPSDSATTAPSVANSAPPMSSPTMPALASGTTPGSLLGPARAYAQDMGSNNFGGPIISPPSSATTAPSSAGGLGAPSGGSLLTAPNSLHSPLVPSSNSGLGGLPLTTGNTTPSTPTSILPPATTNTSTVAPRAGNTLNLDTPARRSTLDLSPTPSSSIPPSFPTPTPSSTIDLNPGTSGSSGAYAIKRGDTFGLLAKRNHVTVSALQAANPGVNSNHLKVGQKITIPAPTASSGSKASTRPASSSRVATTRNGAASSKKGARPAGATTRRAINSGGTYTVKKGDTLRKIAKALYGDESLWRRIFRANRGELASPNDIHPGEVLRLPGK